MSKNDLREIAIAALDYEYGFKPSKKDVTLLESSDDGTYILFSVRGHEYRFSSYIFSEGCGVWAGSGTIEKIAK